MTNIGDTITCPRCKQDYRYHGLIVCDSCHAEVNRLEDEACKDSIQLLDNAD